MSGADTKPKGYRTFSGLRGFFSQFGVEEIRQKAMHFPPQCARAILRLAWWDYGIIAGIPIEKFGISWEYDDDLPEDSELEEALTALGIPEQVASRRTRVIERNTQSLVDASKRHRGNRSRHSNKMDCFVPAI